MSEEQRKHPPLWTELRGHPAFQVAVVFAGASWLTLQAADIFGLATSTVRTIGILLVAVLVLLVGYAFVSVVRGQGHAHAIVARARTRTVVATTAILLVLGTGAWLARPYVVPPLRAGAEVIAVLPFNVSGADLDVLGEGLVDLLSANLNEVGEIRTINPRTTLHAFEQVANGGSIDLDGQLRIGRDIEAGSVLVGSLVSTGSEVRISTELYSVATGDIIARAQESGQPDNVLELVDRLSVQLMQDIWRSNAPMPELRVAAITTTSPAAVKAYLRGEQFYRRVQWDSAQAAFEEAVRHDSTFALAHYRLGETFGWRESLGSEGARKHADQAARYADRLPTPTRKLIVAHQLHEQGDVAALDALQDYVNEYPDDVAGHYLLADARSHAGALIGLDVPTMLEGFERVFERDSTFAPNYAHLIELSLLAGDSARYDRYLSSFRALLPSEAGAYEVARDVRWGERDAALAAVGSALRTGGSSRMQAMARVMNAASARAFAPTPDTDFALAAIDSLEAAISGVPQALNQARHSRIGLYGSTGRLQRAGELVAQMRARNPEQALNASILLLITGLAEGDAFAPERKLLESAADRPNGAYWNAIRALSASDVAAARRHVAVIARDTAQQAVPQEMVDALQGWIAVAAGDTLAGITQMRRALFRLGYEPGRSGPTGVLRVQLAIFQASHSQWRAEGIRRLELMAAQDGGMLSYVAVPLAEAYYAEGRIEDARSAYARFLALWQDADPEMRPRVEYVENALVRITGERAAT